MKKILSICISFSMAFMPLTSRAQTPAEMENSTNLEKYVVEQVQNVQSELSQHGIKVYSSDGASEISLAKALNSGDFIMDASAMYLGIVRIKKTSIDVKQNKITFAVALIKSLNDTYSNDVTHIQIDTNSSAEHMVSSVQQALENLKTEQIISKMHDIDKSTFKSRKEMQFYALLTGTIFLTFAVLLSITIPITLREHKGKPKFDLKIDLGTRSFAILFFLSESAIFF